MPNNPTPTKATDKLYPLMDSEDLGGWYVRHLDAMTVECLHAKSSIAAQLAWRDMRLEALLARVAELERERDEARKLLAEAEARMQKIVGVCVDVQLDYLNAVDAIQQIHDAALSPTSARAEQSASEVPPKP